LNVCKGEVLIAVPNVAAMKEAEARSTLTTSGFVTTVNYEPSETVSEGQVISQNPAASAQLKKGGGVTLVVSSGSQKLAVPLVVGKEESDAVTMLETAGFTADVDEEESTVPQGQVIKQTPSAGTTLARNATVSIVVSKGVVLKVTVPDVVGQAENDAKNAVVAAELKAQVKTAAGTEPEGTVIKQEPGAGASVNQNSTVTLTVSQGPPLQVPDTVGKTQAEAESIIAALGLTTSVKTAASETVPAGSVISMAPAAGASVAKGSAVTLTVSQGPPLKMPDIVGKTQAEAESTIAAIGLVTSIKNAVSETVPVGNVISQTPAAGATVARGSTATLTISQGPAPVKVPNVVGKAQAQAESAITTAGLTSNATTSYSETVANGVVISQDPAANTSLARGTAVNIVVSMGREPISVPNIVGRSQAEAQSAITGAGLAFGGVTQTKYSDSVPNGVVISQEPAAGGSVQRGTSVSVVLSKGASQWSEWVESLPSGVTSATHEIENKNQARTRTKETTTSSSSSMEGWIADGQVTSWGNYGDWTGWSTSNPGGNTDSREVEQRSETVSYLVICYQTQDANDPYNRWFRDFSLNGNYAGYGARASYGEHYYEWTVSRGEYDSLPRIGPGGWRNEFQSGYNKTTGSTGISGNERIWFKKNENKETQYHYRERTQIITYKFYRWTDWGAWQDGTGSTSGNTEAENRSLSRYREK
jgi:beta-lactam-binding protein with PASTA domain